MEAIAVIREIESSEEFRAWRKANPDAYLTSAFSMFSDENERAWLISYYSAKKEMITTFSGESSSEEEAFKKEDGIPELRLEDARINESDALKAAKGVLTDDYSEKAKSVVMVLQNLDGEALWNTTFITEAFKVVNVRVSALSGKIVSHNASAISDFMQK